MRSVCLAGRVVLESGSITFLLLTIMSMSASLTTTCFNTLTKNGAEFLYTMGMMWGHMWAQWGHTESPGELPSRALPAEHSV